MAAMAPKDFNIHMLFFPLMSKSHTLPMVEMAKLFAARGADVTILITPLNASLVSGADSSIRFHLIPFPSNFSSSLPGTSSHIVSDLFMPSLSVETILRDPFDQVLKELRPDCVVSDLFMPWTYAVAAARGVPRLVFDGFGFFARCLEDAFLKQNPLQNLSPETDSIVLNGLPHRMQFLRSQFPDPDEWAKPTPLSQIWNQAAEVDPKSYGVVVNSFYELEPDYVNHYRNVIGGKAWGVGPVALCNQTSVKTDNESLKWLEGKNPGSVVYICFGTLSNFSSTQLREIAFGILASGHPFIWAVRSASNDWIPEGFEEKIEGGRGLVIREWVPQFLILNHPSVGGFVTHCGWNSCLEAISAGLAMATWPLFGEQFYNEKMVVDLLGIGVEVGAKEYGLMTEDRKEVVTAAMVEAAVRKLMGKSEEADERRRKAKELGLKARRAVAKGGSSYNDVGNLIQELMEKKEKGF
ncbi:hypothetical protein M5K25_019813 [Dendrobium thyrsiflorum]|uniref:Uncharacterized protein n=1 Tax=Dendrobium thyrsiflorum TaxID=117978 RepID=A0ABD0UG01_DENTH